MSLKRRTSVEEWAHWDLRPRPSGYGLNSSWATLLPRVEKRL
jgi:hypothetical protein